MLRGEVVVEEKVDGANVGFSVALDGTIRAQNRGSWLRRGGNAQFDRLWAWMDQRQTDFADALGDRLILFGEWCLAVHSVMYDSLPDWFLGFDVYERGSNRFWDVARRDELLRNLGLASVPRLSKGTFTIEGLKALLSQRSMVGSGPMEGAYIRVEESGWLVARAKIVRPEFTQAIEEHWSKAPLRHNAIRGTASVGVRHRAIDKRLQELKGASRAVPGNQHLTLAEQRGAEEQAEAR